ncbi:MAG TPA: hypothetical protein VFX59_01430 [Polyangiales bacterium]|nr:hypothetical protein [Polyangiales bacterium]
MILPGGLFMLALWASARAVRERYLVRTDTPALQLPSMPALADSSARQCPARS